MCVCSGWQQHWRFVCASTTQNEEQVIRKSSDRKVHGSIPAFPVKGWMCGEPKSGKKMKGNISNMSVNLSLVSSAWPRSSELDEQRSWPLQVDLVDRVVFVGILVVPTTSSADPLPLTVDLMTGAETQTQWQTHSVTRTYCGRVGNLPVWCEWKDSGSWRRWICIRSTPVERCKIWYFKLKVSWANGRNLLAHVA